MINCSSIDSLTGYIMDLLDESSDNPTFVLVGGCSRAGKTTLVSELAETISVAGVNATAVKLDSWLISVDDRKQNSTVLERYEVTAIVASVNKILQGDTICPPVYDVVSRNRVVDSGGDPIAAESGILFVEGVLALAIEELVEKAALKIFVDIPDEHRKNRLIDFYSNTKGLARQEYESIVATREKEEVPYTKKTAINADVLFDGLAIRKESEGI